MNDTDEERIIQALVHCNRARIPQNLIKRTFTWSRQREGFGALRSLLMHGIMVMTDDFRVKLNDTVAKARKEAARARRRE